MATRKEQIEKFRQDHRDMYPNGETFLRCTREEFLAYALIRGRPYWVAERERRSHTERSGPNGYGILKAISNWFPVADLVPVPVLPDGSPGETPTPRGYPWPDLDYDKLLREIDKWLYQNVPVSDRIAWNERQALLRASQQVRKDLNRWTPERVTLRQQGWQTSVKIREGGPEEFKCVFDITRDDGLGDNLDRVIGTDPEICWADLLKKHAVDQG